MILPSYLQKLVGVIILITLPSISYAFQPCIDFKKEISNDGGLTWHDANSEAEAVSITNNASYKFTLSGCPLSYTWDLTNNEVVDELLQLYQQLENKTILEKWRDTIDNSISIAVDAPEICSGYTGTINNIATVSTVATSPVFPGEAVPLSDTDNAWIRCESTIIDGGEGCTPGYWKQPHHFDSWPTVVTPETSYSTVFGRTITVRTGDGLITDPTLLQALSALGGKVNTAARHSTAAYLNSMTSDVSYDLSAEQIIDNLQQSVDSNDFGTLIEALVNFNEQGCPLN
ncbi:MAG: hypothetical protein OEZ38_03150 [Gammaproteobacteria bacterium]|nr:hypothetical protein [Gammaproteobacteria bacterium]